MSTLDRRRPALVTEAFRARVARLLAPLGFERRAQGRALVRKKGKNVHRVEFQSSHRNEPGHAVTWPGLFFEDAATRKLVKGWRAGGILNGPAFALEIPLNVADSDDADLLAALVEERVAFFNWLEDPEAVHHEVSCRYVPGLVDPVLIVPYLRAHLGEDAVLVYVSALLHGRSELAPAFASELEGEVASEGGGLLDHGTQLAAAMRAHGLGPRPDLPPDVVRSTVRSARHLRCFFGRQLRAWGEPEAAQLLRRLGDDAVARLRVAQEALHEPVVESVKAARLVLSAAAGIDRAPRRKAPDPRAFQYHARHTEPFGPKRREASMTPKRRGEI